MSFEFEENVPRHTGIYPNLGQGLKVFHEHDFAEVDIVAVPGLGTNPEECWTWTAINKGNPGRSKTTNPSALPDPVETPRDAVDAERRFNWLRDPDGLALIFPRSRIMLYEYASAWRGRRKVRATMKSICSCLLDDLKEKRKTGTETTRPLIFIGHSMGGVVIAKTLCMAKSRRELEGIVTCTMGCAFFGAPFRGSNMAKVALLYSSVFGNEAYESLLSFMRTEKNDTLDEVTDDFVEISNKLVPPIELFCAWEQVPTQVSYGERAAQKIPRLLQHKFFKAGARKAMEVGCSAMLGNGTHFVEKESATLQGAHSVGLTSDHRDLIKFESITSEKFVPVKAALTKMVHASRINVRKRISSSGQSLLTQRFVNQVRQSLEGVDMRQKFRAKIGQRPISSWLTSEPLYQEWLKPATGANPRYSYLWLKGGPGLGKTNATLAAIHQIGQTHLAEQQMDTPVVQSETMLAYFLCEGVSGCCTAEDVLKSLIIQIINQQESLAQHARWFVPNPRYRGPTKDDGRTRDEETSTSGTKATATVDNLWKCLQDIIDDPAVNSIHIIMSNIHLLEFSESTNALLSKLREYAFALVNTPADARRSKWLVTSRNDKHICNELSAECIAVIDLENDLEYGGKVKVARQKYAKEAVIRLRSSKKYSSDLAYYVRNSIESQSEDEHWIDVLCILLGAMPENTSNLTIRKWLKEVASFNTNRLVDHAWNRILCEDEDARLEMEELMQALAIAYEPPTMADLMVLTQIDNVQRLEQLIQMCSPILKVGDSGEHKERIIFSNPEFGERISAVAHGGLDRSNPQRKRYHGLMALRCFRFIKSYYGHGSKGMKDLMHSSSVTARVVEDTLVLTNDDDEADETEQAVTQTSNLGCLYPIKHLFRHLSEGFPDVAEELCEDDPNFWGLQSSLRDRWLEDFKAFSTDLKTLNTSGMSALHVAAGIGAAELVSILVSKYGTEALSWTSDDGMTALHVAASNNHYSVVDMLIRAGVDIESGDGSNAGTALHQAALPGNCAIMGLLIANGASVNASSEKIGPVINAAIRSGTVDAVKQIMGGDVRFDLDYTTCDPPLSLSAGISEPNLFREILETGREKWLQNAKLLDQALVSASYSGRLESVRILLRFQHIYTNTTIETAILSAALENNWASVNELLDHVMGDIAQGTRRDLKLDEAFHLAAISREDRLDILEKIWTFKSNIIPQDIRDFSLYQACVLKKNTTAAWLLETCEASANATAERPSSVTTDYANAASIADYWNALNAAASTGNAPLVRLLIDKGAKINGDRVYALQLASSEGHRDVVKILLDQGALMDEVVADAEELGFFSGTALQAACDSNRTGVVEELVKHGADPNIGGGSFAHPIVAATQRAQPGILRLLLDAPGIDVNVTGGEDRSTPLINAATHMTTDFVELLIQRGADINAQNSSGDTALIMAACKGNKDCVETLCNAGADLNYRSPRHGLAIQVAADGSHPLCAHVLAERMCGTIEKYQEQVKIDPSKAALEEALATLKERNEIIQGLEAVLADTSEQLESAKKDIDFHQLENKRLLSVSSLQGETYESIDQQMKAVQSERVELLKQLESAKGQVKLGNDTITNLQMLLDEERKTNAAVRQRQGWTSLQEEKRAAMEMSESERQKKEELQEELSALHNELDVLRSSLREAKTDLLSAYAEVDDAARQTGIERQQKENLQKEMEEVLASVKAAAERSKIGPAESRSMACDTDTNEQSDHFGLGINGKGSGTEKGLHTLNDRIESPMSSKSVDSLSQVGSPTLSPQPSDGRFRTIHGHHRPDGSLGGYRTERKIRGMASNTLDNDFTRNGLSEGRSLSTESLGSNGRHATTTVVDVGAYAGYLGPAGKAPQTPK